MDALSSSRRIKVEAEFEFAIHKIADTSDEAQEWAIRAQCVRRDRIASMIGSRFNAVVAGLG